MDPNVKVQRYLDDLRRDDRGNENETMKTVRGPGQAAKDPLQFVSTRSGDNMAERARMLVTATEQQKRQREERHEKTQSRVVEEDNWQADLDTWRRKRKTKAEGSSPSAESPTTPSYGSSVDYGIIRKNSTKEEILTIRSPEDSHDSGIENRTLSHSPSTSIDFSPRSADLLTSPKTLETSLPPSYAPPPPPLDQVLVPLSTPAVASRQSAEEPEDYPLPPSHLRKTHLSQDSQSDVLSNRARVSATFAAPPSRQHLEVSQPFVAQKDHHGSYERSVNADLTVELNREQKAHVSATKFPGRYMTAKEESKREAPAPRHSYVPRSDDREISKREAPAPRHSYTPRSYDDKNLKSSIVSTVRYSFESGAPAKLAMSASTPNVSGQPKPVYRAVDIPFDDSTATYQPPKRDKDGLMTIVIEMGGQPVHKGFGFTVSCERRRCFVDSVIVGTPADRFGLLIGDRIESINGERVDDKYPSAITRLLHESARNGEVVLRVERSLTKSSFGSTPNLAAPVGNKFNQAKSVFSEKQTDSYAEFKRRHSRAAKDKPAPREYNSLPRSSSTGFIDNEYGRASDYRVSSLHESRKPGKLDDFVPEAERGSGYGYSAGSLPTGARQGLSAGLRNSREETRTIRNYELSNSSPTKPEPVVQKTPSKNSLEDDTLPGKAYLRKNLRQVLKTVDIEEDLSDYMEPSYTIYAVPDEIENDEKDMFHVVGKYGTEGKRRGREQVSSVSHRFYDKEGRWVERAQSEERVIPIRRERGPGQQHESHDWRDVINQQRQAAPGRTADTRRIQEATSSLSALPDIIDKKLEEQRKLLEDRTDYRYGRSLERRDKEPREVYERSEYTFYEKKYTPPPFERYSSSVGQETERREPVVERDYGYVPKEMKERAQEEREVPTREVEERREKRKAVTREPENAGRDQVVAVSGKHRCAHCGEELGRGAAMIVESLNLFYHLACFTCFVCKTPLGSGNTGADVRVREGRLHCQSCYSSDRLQLSKV